jgi:hypothetical protein
MFHRISLEEWESALTVFSFVVFFFVFITTAIRAWRTAPRAIQHMENLPLEDDCHV